MFALVALLLGLARPPVAYVGAGANRVPLAISSWCWDSRCGAPIAASAGTATVARGATVRIELRFVPTRAWAVVGGVRQHTSSRGREVSWRATHAGGIALNVAAAQGWITYVGRLSLR
ncbi:MAG TPA: hypothetical protein VNC40_01385 [Gaiellaceae bacterium]|nr:hypothetical protein [Gaiellaceae bacterium]